MGGMKEGHWEHLLSACQSACVVEILIQTHMSHEFPGSKPTCRKEGRGIAQRFSPQFLLREKARAFGYIQCSLRSPCALSGSGGLVPCTKRENSDIIRGEEGRFYIPKGANSKKPLKRGS